MSGNNGKKRGIPEIPKLRWEEVEGEAEALVVAGKGRKGEEPSGAEGAAEASTKIGGMERRARFLVWPTVHRRGDVWVGVAFLVLGLSVFYSLWEEAGGRIGGAMLLLLAVFLFWFSVREPAGGAESLVREPAGGVESLVRESAGGAGSLGREPAGRKLLLGLGLWGWLWLWFRAALGCIWGVCCVLWVLIAATGLAWEVLSESPIFTQQVVDAFWVLSVLVGGVVGACLAVFWASLFWRGFVGGYLGLFLGFGLGWVLGRWIGGENFDAVLALVFGYVGSAGCGIVLRCPLGCATV